MTILVLGLWMSLELMWLLLGMAAHNNRNYTIIYADFYNNYTLIFTYNCVICNQWTGMSIIAEALNKFSNQERIECDIDLWSILVSINFSTHYHDVSIAVFRRLIVEAVVKKDYLIVGSRAHKSSPCPYCCMTFHNLTFKD